MLVEQVLYICGPATESTTVPENDGGHLSGFKKACVHGDALEKSAGSRHADSFFLEFSIHSLILQIRSKEADSHFIHDDFSV